ncbi:hypothetical protein [Falsirhodobacter deserti]|uniref:hypothetical protein n=1 Tax=Falsirhodobacter deserti TaxID=1365611 RepID=UPI000FE2DCF8|nr:hypothetical protein [Falsirhodobacter deserti]
MKASEGAVDCARSSAPEEAGFPFVAVRRRRQVICHCIVEVDFLDRIRLRQDQKVIGALLLRMIRMVAAGMAGEISARSRVSFCVHTARSTFRMRSRAMR